MSWLASLRQEADRAIRLDSDLEFFAAERLKVRPKSGGLQPFKFNAAQRRL
ncbi:MAG: hypothetical protein JO254_04755, partial [Pseudolabrys sp.]|nr:hypothetical protein [Pseudolabrys sp.]